jgi:tripartite-type tricarboxylate transporter receptor subunit TctC
MAVRRRAGRFIGIFVLCLTAGLQAASAAYPDRPIRWIIPAAAGGGADAAVRVITVALTLRMGQPFVIDNRPGAAGAIGLETIAKAAPDGYTLGTANLSNFVVASLVSTRLPYKPDRDFTPVAKLTTQPNLLAVTASLPVRSVAELITYAKGHPKDLFYGSSGSGSALHVVTELFRTSAGIELAHVPYKSSVAAGTDLASGQIQLMIDNLSTMAPNVKGGRIRALAITGPKRSSLLPDVPTMSEAGVPAAEMVTWGGVVGPAKLPADIVKRLNSEINAVLADPAVIGQLNELGYDAAPTTTVQFADLIKADNAKWSAVITRGNIKAD